MSLVFVDLVADHLFSISFLVCRKLFVLANIPCLLYIPQLLICQSWNSHDVLSTCDIHSILWNPIVLGFISFLHLKSAVPDPSFFSENVVQKEYSSLLSFTVADISSTVTKLMALGAELDGPIKYEIHGKVNWTKIYLFLPIQLLPCFKAHPLLCLRTCISVLYTFRRI